MLADEWDLLRIFYLLCFIYIIISLYYGTILYFILFIISIKIININALNVSLGPGGGVVCKSLRTRSRGAVRGWV